MKRNVLSIIVLSTLFFVFSCGPKLLSEEEVSKKVEETFDAQVEALEAVLDAECEERFDGLVESLRDSILAVNEEE